MLFSRVFAATQPRTVFTPLPTASTPPRGSNSHRNLFRINTYKSLSKQTTLTVVESYSYKKHRGWGALLTRNPKMARVLRPGGDHKVPIAGNFYPDRPNLSRPGRELLGERRAFVCESRFIGTIARRFNVPPFRSAFCIPEVIAGRSVQAGNVPYQLTRNQL